MSVSEKSRDDLLQELHQLQDRIAALEREAADRDQARQALQESEAKFRALTETAACGIFIFQGETVRYLNPAAEAATGYSRAELLGANFWELVHPDYREMVRQRGLARQRGEPVIPRYEIPIHTRAGEERWLDVSASYIEYEGRPAILGTALDITVRRRADQERAGLLAQERAARAEAEEALRRHRDLEERLTLLAEASGSLLGSLELGAVLPAILDLSRRMIAADAYAVWRQDLSSPEWRAVSSVGLSATYWKAANQSGQHTGLTLDQPLVFENVDEAPVLAERLELYHAEGIRSILAVPLKIQGRNSGTITFYYRQPHRFSETEIRLATALANLAAAAIGATELYQEQSRVRAEAEAAERGWAFLAEASAILGSSLDYEKTLASVARLAVPHVADWCAIYMVEPDGSLRRLAAADVDSSKIRWVRELELRYPTDLNAAHGVPKVIRTGQPEIYPEITDEMLVRNARDAGHLEILRRIGFKSYMCVPLVARGATLGAISFGSAESGRRFDESDLGLAQHLARRAALAVDNALLYEAAQRERAAADAALEAERQIEARFRRLVESNIIGIILADNERIREANDLFLEMLGYTREDLAAGRLRWRDMTPAKYRQIDDRKIEDMLVRGACAPYEKEFLRKDSGHIPVLLGGAVLEPPPVWTSVFFVLDLSERKRLEERLRYSQKLESLFALAGGVAHDFNNLLTAILGNAGLALGELTPDHPVGIRLRDVIQASERAADLTRQLLAYSGKGHFVVEPVDLSALVRDIAGLVHSGISKKVQLELVLDPDLPAVEADSTQVQQLLMNLLINGAEAIGDAAGTVTVVTGTEDLDERRLRQQFPSDELTPGKYVFVEVRDTGCGMDEETKARIFDPFFTTKFTGRGLGLAAAQGIVRGHKGAIQVVSSPGRGSTFKVLLPASPARKSEPEAAGTGGSLEGSGLILVVDDEEVVRQTAKAALEHYGYSVLLAENGRDAVEVFRNEADRLSLVLLDMTMPVMSGEEALGQLHQIRSQVPVLATSGYSEAEAARRFGEKRVHGFIEKPYTAEQLAEKVKSVIRTTTVAES